MREKGRERGGQREEGRERRAERAGQREQGRERRAERRGQREGDREDGERGKESYYTTRLVLVVSSSSDYFVNFGIFKLGVHLIKVFWSKFTRISF